MLEVGRIVKAHGLFGEVIVELFTNRHERLAPGGQLNAGDDVLLVKSSSQHQNRWIVAFDGVNDRTSAEKLRNTVLSAEPIEDETALWIHELVGAEVFDMQGSRVGVVESVLANLAGDIMELDDGVLIPLRFVVEKGAGFVRVDPPAGLIELYRS